MSRVKPLPQIPPEELEFRFKGGNLALNFVATVGERWRGNVERLMTPEDLDRWCAESGLGTPAHASKAGDLAQAKRLREAIYRAVCDTMAGTVVDVTDRETINRWARSADVAPQWIGPGVAQAVPCSARSVMSTVARAAVRLLGGAHVDRLRECAADNCSTLFVDVSRAADRRWCSKRCADRVNARRYRDRHRDR